MKFIVNYFITGKVQSDDNMVSILIVEFLETWN